MIRRRATGEESARAGERRHRKVERDLSVEGRGKAIGAFEDHVASRRIDPAVSPRGYERTCLEETPRDADLRTINHGRSLSEPCSSAEPMFSRGQPRAIRRSESGNLYRSVVAALDGRPRRGPPGAESALIDAEGN